jgi:hypothetical protein
MTALDWQEPLLVLWRLRSSHQHLSSQICKGSRCYYRICTCSVKTKGVWYQLKKRLDNPSESAQLVDCDSPCGDRVVVLSTIISPKVKALLIPITSLHFPNLSFSCMIDCGSSHYAKVNYFPIVSVPRMRLCLIDGSSPSYIMRATDIFVWFPCGTTHQVSFLITKLDAKFPAVLRLDWLTLHNPLINWADSSVTFWDHPDTLPVTTTQSVLANLEELPSDDDTSSNLSEDLPDPNPVNIPEPTTKFISNPIVDSISIADTIPASNSIPNNSSH